MTPQATHARQAVATLLLCVTATAGVQAQANKLYATDGRVGGNTVSVIQNGAVINTFTGNTRAWALAVNTDVRTLGNGVGANGQEYNLDGTLVGGPYARPAGNPDQFYDGTTDGTFNYTVSSSGTNQVYRAALDWTNLTPIFSVSEPSLGITYDRGDNSLWVSAFTNVLRTVTEYSLNGSVMSSFIVPGTGVTTALAYDGSDQSLWLSYFDGSGQMYQYDRAGNLLSTIDTGDQAFFGAEFSEAVVATPEPASVALLATGLLGVLGVARRKRRS